MLYWLGRKLIDESAGVMAAVTCALVVGLTLNVRPRRSRHPVRGVFCHRRLCLLWPAAESATVRRQFAAGLLFGIAVLMKQHAAIFALWG